MVGGRFFGWWEVGYLGGGGEVVWMVGGRLFG